VKNAYISFRAKKGLDAIDFSDPANADHLVQLCIDCLLDCFEANRVGGEDKEED